MSQLDLFGSGAAADPAGTPGGVADAPRDEAPRDDARAHSTPSEVPRSAPPALAPPPEAPAAVSTPGSDALDAPALSLSAPNAPQVGPAPVDGDWAAAAAAVPAHIRLGTSSWSFSGWNGIVYARSYETSVLAREGLLAYGQHPLFGCVGIDRTYYGPIDAAAFAAYAAQVPAGFRFVVKAHDGCTTAKFPDRPRYGQRRGQENPHFLDAAYARDEVVGPAMEGLGDKLGVIVFQFPPHDVHSYGGPGRFAALLDRFLGRLPAGPGYAVELRTPGLMSRDYVDVLEENGASHCLTVHPTMPPISVQAHRLQRGLGPRLVVRWNLARDLRYESAKREFQPFDRLVQDDVDSRDAIAALLREAMVDGRDAFVVANNKAEGVVAVDDPALGRIAGIGGIDLIE